MFNPVSNKVNFPESEEATLAFWEQEQIFKQSLKQREDAPHYVFYDGPPFATGLPHYGHLLAGTIKDIIPRYHSMRGHYVERRFGWDCHGLPIEALAQEDLGLAGTAAILDAGIDVFNEKCRSMVLTYTEEWRKTVTRMGRWVDFDNDYKTMDVNFMESIWWVFKELWSQDRVYKAHRIMPYSYALTTPLSNFEANRNYQTVQDPAVTCSLKITEGFDEEAYLLIWTTTPWTLPSNLGVCAGPDIDYVAVRDVAEGTVYILAEARLGAYYKKPEQYEIVKRMKGADLKGVRYEPLFNYFADQANSFVVLNDAYVTTEDGTGLVHLAPAYGEDDYRICRDAEIELVDPLDSEAKFTSQVPEFEGVQCKDADKAIIRNLKEQGKLVHQSTIEHSYPFCERTDTPLIYRAIDAWYVRIEDIREDLIKNNDQIHWVPDYVGSKRFGNWLADAKDWNISRNRYWGSCIPVWVSDDGEDLICVGSIEELYELSGVRVDDLHKHIIDKITFEKDGSTYTRTPEVLDCWFESGAMPYAQQHYPFENKEVVEAGFPADFIAEGLDQTRGWFYTLTILSTLLFKKPAFKNVVVNGLILAEDGRKMSKRLKNYPDPKLVIDSYGADAIRLYMINSPVVRAEDLCFTEEGVRQMMKDLMIPLWNAYSFFVTYANIDEWGPEKRTGEAPANLMDRWILSSLETLSVRVTTALDVYDLQNAVRPFTHFIEDLTNWYIRRSRRRFWKSSDDHDKQQAYETLYTVLVQLSKIAAPFLPFVSENIFRNLRTEADPISVHLCDFPTGNDAARLKDLEEQMEMVTSVVSMGRSLRSSYDLKIRQPLKGIHVATRNKDILKNLDELKPLIEEELNVKEVWFLDHEKDLAHLSAKPNFKVCGPRFGKRMKAVSAVVGAMTDDQLEQLLGEGQITLALEGEATTFSSDEIQVNRTPREGLAVASEGEVVVALETELNADLLQEGLAREFVNKVQNMRKSMDLEVTQRIELGYESTDEVAQAILKHREYIQNEVLALSCEAGNKGGTHQSWDLNGYECAIYVTAS